MRTGHAKLKFTYQNMALTREVYAALLLPNFQVHWHIKVIPVVTSSVAHTPQHQVYESTANPRTMELEQSFQLIDYN